LLTQINTDVPVVKVARKTTKRRWLVVYYIRTWEIHQMKIICTRQNKDKSYDQVGMNNRFLTSKYTTTRNFLRYGLPAHFYGNTLKLEVFYGDNIYRAPDKTMYVTV
jgi:hypothetical protein